MMDMIDADDLAATSAAAAVWSSCVLEALGGLRLNPVQYEAELCVTIAGALEGAGIPFEREVSLGQRCRIDFLCAGGVGIEVKKGWPNRAALVAQARRYCLSAGTTGLEKRVLALVLVVERNVVHAPETVEDTPVYYVGLDANWGMAV